MNAVISKGAIIGSAFKAGYGAIIHSGVEIGDNVEVGDNTIIYSGTIIKSGTRVQAGCLLGINFDQKNKPELVIGVDSYVRTGTVIYSDVIIGDRFQTGHYALIRENCIIGKDVLIGSYSVLDGEVTLGNNVKVQTGVYLTRFVTVGANTFLGPYVKTTNDKYMQYGNQLKGNKIGKSCRLGCGTILLPGIALGENVVTGAGTVVVRDVAENLVVIGNPGRVLKEVDDLERGGLFDSHR